MTFVELKLLGAGPSAFSRILASAAVAVDVIDLADESGLLGFFVER